MPEKPIKLRGKNVHIHKAIVAPDFTKPTVLVQNQWEYVAMWLRRNSADRSLFFWDQAGHFCQATRGLPNTSSPLTSYYSALNATKALFISKNIPHADFHGLRSAHTSSRCHLQNECVGFLANGVFPALSSYLGEPTHEETFTLKDILYNLPFVHRAYTLTFTSQPHLFIPIDNPIFARKQGSSEAWFRCSIRGGRYQSQRTVSIIPGFERHHGIQNGYVVRATKTFEWKRGDSEQNNIRRLTGYHRGIRKRAFYIRGQHRLWYLKRDDKPAGVIKRSCLSLTFAALHCLSELARYTPDRLGKHFEARHNWLLSEFLDRALDQFIDQISSEITGNDFMLPGYSG